MQDNSNNISTVVNTESCQENGECSNSGQVLTSGYIIDGLHQLFSLKLTEVLKDISKTYSVDYKTLETKYIGNGNNNINLDIPLVTKPKRKKIKSLSKDKLCMARKADGQQCTRRRKDCTEFCGKHSGTLKFGRIDDEDKLSKNENFVQCSAIQIDGTDYLIDKNRVVYSYNIDNPTIVGGLNEAGELIKVSA
tara:strand:- start:6057 stop:6635 length:579 start_codon:yes stop_codon:yes gene_type:complete